MFNKLINYLNIIVYLVFGYYYLVNNKIYSQAILNEKINLGQIKNEVIIDSLENGLKFYIHENSNPKNEVTIFLVVKAGVFNEEKDQLGLAHFVEHMAFNGTKNFPKNVVLDYLGKQGLKFGKDYNASTSKITKYYFKIPSDNSKLLENCFQVLRDWAQDISFDSLEVEKERGVILAESRRGESNAFKSTLLIKSKLLNHPKYPENSRELHDSNIKNFNISSLIKFYKQWYCSNNEAIIVVGDVNKNEIKSIIQQKFSDLKKIENLKPLDSFLKEYNVPLQQSDEIIDILHNVPNTIIDIYQKREASLKSIKTISNFELYVKDVLFNKMVKGRIDELTKSYSPPFQQAFSKIERNTIKESAGLDALRTYISLNKSQPIENAIFSIYNELERIVKHGFINNEFSLAIQELINQYKDTSKESSNDIAYKYIDDFVEGKYIISKEHEFGLLIKTLEKISLEDMNTFAKNWIKDLNNIDIVIRYHENQSIPNKADIIDLIKKITKENQKPYMPNDKIVAPLIDLSVFDKQIKTGDFKINRNNNLNQIGVTEVILSNGIKVLLKPLSNDSTNPKTIIFNGFNTNGLDKLNEDDYIIANNVADIMKFSGYGKYSVFQLNSYLKEKNVQFGQGIKGKTTNIYSSCSTNEIETLLQILYISSQSQIKKKEIFELWKIKNKKEDFNSSVKSIEDTIQSTLENLIYKDLSNINPSKINLNEFILDKVHEVYNKIYTNIDDYTFVCVGNFKTKEIVPLLNKYLGSITSNSFHSPKKINITKVKQLNFGKRVKTIYLDTNNLAKVRMHIPIKYKNSIKNKVHLKLLEKVIEYRLNQRLRENESGTYSVGVYSQELKDTKDVFLISIGFESAVNNCQNMINACNDELNNLKKFGVDTDLLFSIKTQVLKEVETDFKSIYFWADYLKTKTIKQENYSDILKFKSHLSNVEIKNINRFIANYFTTNNLIEIKILPKKVNK